MLFRSYQICWNYSYKGSYHTRRLPRVAPLRRCWPLDASNSKFPVTLYTPAVRLVICFFTSVLAKCLHDVWAHERGGPELQHQNLLVRVAWFYSSVVGEQNTVKTLTRNPHPSSSSAPSSPLPTARPPLTPHCRRRGPSAAPPPPDLHPRHASLSCPLSTRSRAVLTADGV